MECRYPEITAGAAVAERIRQQLHPDEGWSMSLAQRIAGELTLLKDVGRRYHPDLGIVAVLHRLAGWGAGDMQEALEMHGQPATASPGGGMIGSG